MLMIMTNVIKILHMWKKKLGTVNAFIIVTIVFFILLFQVFSGLPFLNSLKNIPSKSSYSIINLELLAAQKKIILLRSVLKKNNIPEAEYSELNNIPIYVITPTYKRPEQKAELTRLKNVFLHIPALHWIVIEDADSATNLVSNFLSLSMLTYTHLHVPTPPDWKLKEKEPRWRKPRGVLQRNLGIRWLRENYKSSSLGVVYFADDDNTYSIELFDEMRGTNKVSVWPVGLVGEVLVERPKLDSDGKVVGWQAGWRPNRSFATDMAGFAVNLALLISSPNASFSHESETGLMESDFLKKLVVIHELEPKANLCTKVFVWHTQTKETKLRQEEKLRLQGSGTNKNIEV